LITPDEANTLNQADALIQEVIAVDAFLQETHREA